MAITNLFSSWKYHALRASPSEDAEVESDLNSPGNPDYEKTQRVNHRHAHLRLIAPWIASTVFFAILAVYFGLQSSKHLPAPQPGPFNTDFQAAKALVEYEERVFTGQLDYDPVSGKPYRVLDPFEPQYFGEPSLEIESLWNELLKDEFSLMTDTEAAPFTPELTPLWWDGEYHFEFSVMHSLHCLNAARKKLDEYYLSPCQETPQNFTAYSDNWERVHIDHCLDHLRQAIQCHGDLSPVPLYSWQGVPLGLGVGKTHTCRKFEPIREWMDWRAATMKPSHESR